MEGLFIMLLFWGIFGSLGKIMKKAAEQQKNGRSPAKPVRPAPKPVQPAQARKKAPAPVREEHHPAPAFEAHMHTPVMGIEGEGTEGIDCCHEFMLEDRREMEPNDILTLTDDDENARAKALLQGVIFSEILGRRTVRRFGGRNA